MLGDPRPDVFLFVEVGTAFESAFEVSPGDIGIRRAGNVDCTVISITGQFQTFSAIRTVG